MFLSLSSSRTMKTLTYQFRMLFFPKKASAVLLLKVSQTSFIYPLFATYWTFAWIEFLFQHGLIILSRLWLNNFSWNETDFLSHFWRKLIKLNLYFLSHFLFWQQFLSPCRMLKSPPRLTTLILQTLWFSLSLFSLFASHPAPHV